MADQQRWSMDFSSIGISYDKKLNLDPPGYDTQAAKEPIVGSSAVSRRQADDADVLRKKQDALFQRATGPIKQVAFMCFMMWMMGNGIQIFSIIMTLSGLAQPIMAIVKSGEAFPKDPAGRLDVITPRLIFCLVQVGQLLFVLNKLNSMGLLPTHASDWLSELPVPPPATVAVQAL